MIFFVFGWIKKIDCENQRELNQELELKLEIEKQMNINLKNEIENLSTKRNTAANNG